MNNDELQLFEDKKIRTAWDEEKEEWYFSVVDVVAVLTDSVNPTDYLKKLRKRDEQLGAYLGTNCPQVAMRTTTGKLRKRLPPPQNSSFGLFSPSPLRKRSRLSCGLRK